MKIVIGIWIATIGYALVFTGVQFFTSGSGSLSQSLGLTQPLLGNTLGTVTKTAAQQTPDPTTTSTLG